MKKTLNNHLYLGLLVLISFMVIPSCKKTPDNNEVTRLSDADSLTYLMYRTMLVSFVDGGRDSSFDLPTYYWYTQVPPLNPLSGEYDSADVLLNKIKTYAINPDNGQPYDKYSFLDKTGEVSGEIQQGVAGDMGMQVTYAQDGQNNYYLFVLFADKNSPAGKKGVTRGWEITAINGDNNISYDGSDGPNVNKVIDAVYNAPQTTFQFKKPDGSSVSFTLSKASYEINPVLFDTVYSVGTKKVGYFVFNTFSNVTNDGGPTLTKQELDRVFNRFSAANIQSLIIDIRYNGGGSVPTAEYIDNKVAPSSAGGKLMYSYIYNDKLSPVADQIGLDDHVNFDGSGNLNLEHVFFIGSGNTASASELTLNNLRPYVDVKLVGQTTYGKPVGFFGLTLSDYNAAGQEQNLADLYAINFETKNADGHGGYFDGITPDATASDFVNYSWGDPNDDNLIKIFGFIANGKFGRVSVAQRMAKDKSLRLSLPATVHSIRFNGMVDYKNSQKVQTYIDKKLGRIR